MRLIISFKVTLIIMTLRTLSIKSTVAQLTLVNGCQKFKELDKISESLI